MKAYDRWTLFWRKRPLGPSSSFWSSRTGGGGTRIIANARPSQIARPWWLRLFRVYDVLMVEWGLHVLIKTIRLFGAGAVVGFWKHVLPR